MTACDIGCPRSKAPLVDPPAGDETPQEHRGVTPHSWGDLTGCEGVPERVHPLKLFVEANLPYQVTTLYLILARGPS
jgi:hypothetical protein